MAPTSQVQQRDAEAPTSEVQPRDAEAQQQKPHVTDQVSRSGGLGIAVVFHWPRMNGQAARKKVKIRSPGGARIYSNGRWHPVRLPATLIVQ